MFPFISDFSFFKLGYISASVSFHESVAFLEQAGSRDKTFDRYKFFFKKYCKLIPIYFSSYFLRPVDLIFAKTCLNMGQSRNATILESFGNFGNADLQNLVVHWLRLFVMLSGIGKPNFIF